MNLSAGRSPGDTSRAADAAVRARGLRVVRGARTVLDDFDLDVRQGTLTGLLGPSGSGKSTLMRAIVGVQRVAGGAVDVLGRPAGAKVLRDRVGYVTQEPAVYGDLTIRQNLRYFARVLGAPRSDVDRVIDQVQLGSHADHLVSRLSGGQRSRVSLATALLGTPELIVLDEPTVGLDPVLRVELWGLFHRIVEAGATLLVSSHVMDEAERCERLVLLREGSLLADDTLPNLLERTGTGDAEQAFLKLIEQADNGMRTP
ncbi:ABC-2 type transport system ATP-binding protein [Haloactinopolyspora alba]|uniref:ABC-2 type transport system ATP-binding protein n=2 Tax=Haloactinopolyspora alba TaxID=648780 RepID=A0A2P8DK17_9ACTN|nr:ABC transporter ATP-binding protein [Haloactinopolyspora alba]PSK97521.1 ABC-2 type transport system ATP-binding protein [Haloactinopolyspora alba]